jgi:enoyl-[acyl-carrier protein] reductase II
MFLGDLQNGELEIGQCSAHINDIRSAKDIVDSMWREFTLLREDPLRKDL